MQGSGTVCFDIKDLPVSEGLEWSDFHRLSLPVVLILVHPQTLPIQSKKGREGGLVT